MGSSTNPKSPTDLSLEDLPTELLVKVLFHLDGYTLNSILEVFPSVKNKCILITDRPQSALFTAPGLRQVQLSELSSTANVNNFIKLYEIEDAAGCLKEAIEQDKLQSTVFYKSLNSFSFVHFATEDQGMPHWTRIIQAINETPATAEISSCPLGDIVTQREIDLMHEYDGPTLLDKSTSLVFKTVDYLQDLSLPNLEALTVVFSTELDVPVMRNLDLPGLKKLVIVYPDAFPEMYNIEAPVGSRWERKGSLLEFVHLPSIRTDLNVLLDYKHQILPEATVGCIGGLERWRLYGPVKYIPLVLSFLRINVTGGPLALYRHLTPLETREYHVNKNYNVTHLHIKRTSMMYNCLNADRNMLWRGRRDAIRLHLYQLSMLSYESSAMTVMPYALHDSLKGRPFNRVRRASRDGRHSRFLFFSLVYHSNAYHIPSGSIHSNESPPFQDYNSIGDDPMYDSSGTQSIKESLQEWDDLTEFHDRAHCAIYGVNFGRQDQ